MKEYPSIDGINAMPIGEHVICFDKLDGSNLRAQYNPKQGWYKWGTRRRMFDRNDPEYGCAIDIFEKKYGDSLAKAICDYKDFRGVKDFIAYMEFFGPYSFAGKHDISTLNYIGIDVKNNDPKDVVVFDVNLYKKGFISPRDFVKVFAGLPVAQVIYEGILTQELIDDVREGKYPVKEGVVIKTGSGHKLRMCKVKTKAYIEELKQRFGVGWKEYE